MTPEELRRLRAAYPGACPHCWTEPHERHAQRAIPPSSADGQYSPQARARQIAGLAQTARRMAILPPETGNLDRDLAAAERAVEQLDELFAEADGEWRAAGGLDPRIAYAPAGERAALAELTTRRDLIFADRQRAAQRRDRLMARWEHDHNPAAARLHAQEAEMSRYAQRQADRLAGERERGGIDPETLYAQRRADELADERERLPDWRWR